MSRPEEGAAVSEPRISWAQLATAASILAIGAVSTLAIVGSVDDADALSTVALALAIITFITQIVVFIAQTWTTSQLNAETRAFLQELQSSAHGTERALNNQVDKLTDHVLGSLQAVRKGGEDGTELRERVREDVAEALAAPRPRVTDVASERSTQKASSDDRRILQELATFPPEEEGLSLLGILRQLSPITVANLRTFAEDERVSRGLGGVPKLHLSQNHPFSREAMEAGLVEYDPEDPEWARLTRKGRQVARLLLAQEEPPAWLHEN